MPSVGSETRDDHGRVRLERCAASTSRAVTDILAARGREIWPGVCRDHTPTIVAKQQESPGT